MPSKLINERRNRIESNAVRLTFTQCLPPHSSSLSQNHASLRILRNPYGLPAMKIDRLEHLRTVYRSGLLDDVIPFWIRHGIDHEVGGYFSVLDQDGYLLDSNKAVWVQGRFAWLLATLYNTVDKNPEWLQLAKRGLDFLEEYAVDPETGQMWFQLTREGRPLNMQPDRYSESFACIANAAYYQATQEQKYAERAQTLFETFWTHWQKSISPTSSPQKGDADHDRKFGSSMIAINMAQVCRKAGIAGDWDKHIDTSVADIRNHFVHPDIECVMETVAMDGTRLDHLKGRTLNPGHAIEAAWFILEEAKYRNQDKELIRLGTQMLDWMWKRGWDTEQGGIFYYIELDGQPLKESLSDMKFWWPQNETIIATLLAYLLTGEDRYATMHQQVHDYAHTHFPDSKFGEWYSYLNKDGSVAVSMKGSVWKGPFHLPRMQWKCWQLCEEALSNSAPSEKDIVL